MSNKDESNMQHDVSNNPEVHLEEPSYKKSAKLINNPARLLGIIIISIFISESIVMLILVILPPLSKYKEVFFDASLLTLILLPALYFLVYKPFRLHLTVRKQMEKALLEIEYRERRHIGYELHDSLGQLLAGISLKTQSLERHLKDNKVSNVEAVAKINLLIGQAKKQVRLLTKGILPIEVDTEDLIPALKSLVSNTTELFNISSVLICDKPFLIFNKIAVAQLYRIAQEAVMNAVRHGNPENIEINLSRKSNRVELSIKDDGRGFQKSTEQGNGIGLQIMNYRANIIDASLDIKSDINKGTSVTCIFHYKTRDKK